MCALTQCPAPVQDIKIGDLTFSSEWWSHGTSLPELELVMMFCPASHSGYAFCQLYLTLCLQWDISFLTSCPKLLCTATLHWWGLCSTLEVGSFWWWMKGSHTVSKKQFESPLNENCGSREKYYCYQLPSLVSNAEFERVIYTPQRQTRIGV